MPSARQRRGIGYIRVSRVKGRDRNGDSFISPDVQRDRVKEAAAAAGVRIVDWQEDYDQSGKKWNRPGFQAALAAIQEGRAEVLVVSRMSRFARSVLTAEAALKLIEEAGGQLVAGDLPVDTSTPAGRMMRGMLQLVAQWELEVASEQWREAKAKATGRGVLIANRPPIGYRWDKAKLLVPDKCGPVIGEIFDLRAGGASMTELVRHWHERTGRRVHRQTLAHALRNRVYLGEVRNGDVVSEDAHEPLVTPEQFAAVQRPSTPRPARNGEGSLLAGVLHCAGCGRPMTSTSGRGGRRRYACQNFTNREPCPAQASVLQELADPVVEARFLDWAREQARLEGSGDESRLAVAQAEVDSLMAEHRALIGSQQASRYAEAFDEEIARLEDEIDTAREEVDELRASGQVATVRTSAVELWPRLSKADKRKLIAAAIERVDVHPVSGRRVPFESRSEIVFR
jgi:site-specific DNA recombinase